jgi:hypothetical protein
VFLGFLALLFLSEAAYVYKNKWVLYSYILNNIGSTGTAFFVATEGQYALPNNVEYINDVKKDFESLPTFFNLPALIYNLAITAYNDQLPNLTPKLLNISIRMDPDFSFWRVELANYYLLNGNSSQAKNTLDDCLKFEAPRQHCQDFMNGPFTSNQPQKVGFLNQTIRQIYEAGYDQ